MGGGPASAGRTRGSPAQGGVCASQVLSAGPVAARDAQFERLARMGLPREHGLRGAEAPRREAAD
eukprot:42507-Pleurochrysis_carterae.AAC.1